MIVWGQGVILANAEKEFKTFVEKTGIPAAWTILGVSGSMYTLDFKGLITCYVMALPFFKGTLLGFMCYSAFLFGILEFSKHKFEMLKI